MAHKRVTYACKLRRAKGARRAGVVLARLTLARAVSRGIGLMMAEGFVRNGARVIICSRKQAVVEEAAKKLTSVGPVWAPVGAAPPYTPPGRLRFARAPAPASPAI